MKRSLSYFRLVGLIGALSLLHTQADTIYVSTYGGVIEKFTADGSQSHFVDNGLNLPDGLAFDRTGNLYVANSGDDTISVFTPDGTASVFPNTNLSKPGAIACDSAGNLYVTNVGDGTITKLSPKGSAATFATVSITNSNRVALDHADNFYVTTTGATIVKFTPKGAHSVFATCGGANGLPNAPLGLAFDSAGNLYASCGSQIIRVSLSGASSVFAKVPRNGPAPNSTPGPMAFDNKGNLFVVDFISGSIDRFAPDGSYSLFAKTKSPPTDIAILPDPATSPSSSGIQP